MAWFVKTTPTSSPYNCLNDYSLTNGLQMRGDIGEIEEEYLRFATKDAAKTATESQDGAEWMLRRKTLRAVKNLGTKQVKTVEDKQNLDKFGKKHDLSSANDFVDLDIQIESLFDKKSKDDQDLEDLGSNIVKTIKDNPTARMTKLLGEQMQSYFKGLDKRTKKIKDDADKLKSVNAQLKATKPFEIYEKQVNDIYLSVFQQHKVVFTLEQFKTLREIALKCPREVGFATYKARTVLSMGIRDPLPDWKCDNAVIDPRSALVEPKIGLTISPNPAQNEVQMILEAQNFENLTWEISNISGIGVKTGEMTGSNLKIDTQNLDAGIYYVSVKKEGKPIATQKFIIIR